MYLENFSEKEIERAGRFGRAGASGSASQSQRMHGAGYVGAIVGQVGRVEVGRKIVYFSGIGRFNS